MKNVLPILSAGWLTGMCHDTWMSAYVCVY